MPMLGEKLRVDGGYQHIHQNAKSRGNGLNDDVTHRTYLIGGTGDHQKSEGIQRHTHNQQNQIAFAKSFADFS